MFAQPIQQSQTLQKTVLNQNSDSEFERDSGDLFQMTKTANHRLSDEDFTLTKTKHNGTLENKLR